MSYLYKISTDHQQKTCRMISTLEAKKERFDLTTHSTHFIYSYMIVGYMVKGHSDRVAHTVEAPDWLSD